MTATHWGLLVGLVLGVVAAFGGFGAFLLVLVLAAVGLLIGRLLDGRPDLVRPGRRGSMCGGGSPVSSPERSPSRC